MATAVREVELTALPPALTGLEAYDHALVLVRYRGHPVGQATLRVRTGRVDGDELRDAATGAAGERLGERMVREWLAFDPDDAPGARLPLMTVAVCTRDRPEDLRRCLDALMRLPDDGQELLVVDNAPATDATRELVAQHPRARYVREDRRGLNVARNRALAEARHEVVAFVDDDAAPDPGWLRALRRNFDDRAVACVTGLTMPLELETAAQEWFERYSPFGRGFVRRTYSIATHSPVRVSDIGAGVNMALRRDAVARVGWFDEALDAGTRTQSGGDYDIFSRLLLAGARIVYDPAALSWHRHRRSWPELKAAIYGYGVGVYAAWTRTLLVERETTVLWMALRWLLLGQLPALLRAPLGHGGHLPADLLAAELRGCLAGPGAYLASRRAVRTARGAA